MIIDTIKNCGLYAAGNENLKKGFEFIKEFLENPKAVGKYEIDGDNVYAIVQEYETKAPGKFESHKKYTDIQFIVSGKELIGYANIAHLTPDTEYDAEKDFMGLLTFKGNHPTLIEAKTAKNYLNEKELRAMGQLVSGYLDFAERQAEREQVMTMNDWAAYLDRILMMSGEQLLQGSGRVSHEQAMEHATTEYRKYKQRTISDAERDYLLSIKSIEDSINKKDN